MLDKVKLVIVGPIGSGKTTVANILADATNLSNDYRPTAGLRILEFESREILIKQTYEKVDVELWDCSGDEKYSSFWSAMRKDAQGVIFVFSGKVEDHGNQLQKLYDNFVQESKLGPKSCVVFHLDFSTQPKVANYKISPAFSRIAQVSYKIENESERLKEDFHSYLKTIVTNMSDKEL